MKKLKILAAPVIFLLPLVCFGGNPVFQQSEALNVKLGIRDLDGVLGSYTATFVVTDSAGKVVKADVAGEGDKFSYVTFPDDFHTWMVPGVYKWEAVVKGKTVIKGSFEQEGSFILKMPPTN